MLYSVTETRHNSSFFFPPGPHYGPEQVRYQVPYQVPYPFGDPAHEVWTCHQASMGGEERKP